MKRKMKLPEAGRLLLSGELARERPALARGLEWGARFLLGTVLAAAPLLGGAGPLGVALTAQAGGGLAGLFTALGVSLGYLTAFGFDTGIRYVTAVVLTFTTAYLLQDHTLSKKAWLMPLSAGAYTLLTAVLGAMTNPPQGLGSLFAVFLQTVLAVGGCWFFREALSAGERDTETADIRRLVAVTVLCAGVLMTLARLEIPGIASLGRILSMLAVLAVSGRGGALSGCAVGCALGAAMDAAAGGQPFYALAYGVCALTGGLFMRSGKAVFLITVILTGAVCVICVSPIMLRQELIFEVLLASLGYLLLPAPALDALAVYVRPVRLADGEAGLRCYTARRVRRMGDAFRDLYATVDRANTPEQNEEDLSGIFDRAGELVCSRCPDRSACWNRDYLDTLAAFGDLTEPIRNRGIVTVADLPQHFTEKCRNPEGLVCAINGELRGRVYRRQFRDRLREDRAAAYGQYLDAAEVLRDVADELQNAYGPDYLARRRLSRWLSGQGVDADLSVFRDRVGRLHIILESVKLKSLLARPDWLERLSDAAGVRLCRPIAADEDSEGRVTLMEAEPLSVSVGIASLKKKGETVSGDRGTYFKTDQGVLCVILSDGMGSGENAARESVAVVRILERFLRAGVDPAVAMKMLNSMLLLKNQENLGFATVDLMCVDLFTGEASFYKYGAAPSYIRTGKTVRRIRTETMAAGLLAGDEALPDLVRLRLKPGSLALIASDGVVTESSDGWLRTLLTDCDGADTKALAKDALQGALRQYGPGDDMTVLAVRVDHRG
ncbi:MAG: SpoIIE family protein phosphatase [Oscillospiraceae bacterium]|nr:SpoIIE family protein phosphatase [Oscillospiraceae bacterium]